VTEFIYRYESSNSPDQAHPSCAQIFLSFQLSTQSREKEVSEVLESLSKQGFCGMDISDNELAKTHARYMIGGRQAVEHERVFRFSKIFNLNAERYNLLALESPERPGSLRNFLSRLRNDWNISLFHYRYYGGGG
jgi:threonine dehydratase